MTNDPAGPSGDDPRPPADDAAPPAPAYGPAAEDPQPPAYGAPPPPPAPSYGSPDAPPPAYGTPQPQQPQYGQPQYGQPQYGQQPPAYGQPAYGQPAYGAPPPFAPSGYPVPAAGSQKVTTALVMGIIGIVTGWCCGVLGVGLGIGAVVLASQAEREGPQANLTAAKVCGWIAIGIGALGLGSNVLFGLGGFLNN